ncbi:MAG: nuclear transport factor 2 family protein [Acidimicrobiia bacterium]
MTPREDEVHRLAAIESIRQLVARYGPAVDSRDLDTLVHLFVPDVRVGRSAIGRAALRASFAESLGAIGISVLDVGTPVIDLLDADHGIGTVYCKAEIQDGDRWIHQAVVYEGQYRRDDGRWYFVRRRHRLFYGSEVGTNPLLLPPANWLEHHDGRGTVPAAWESWFWADHGGDPSPTPGSEASREPGV